MLARGVVQWWGGRAMIPSTQTEQKSRMCMLITPRCTRKEEMLCFLTEQERQHGKLSVFPRWACDNNRIPTTAQQGILYTEANLF